MPPMAPNEAELKGLMIPGLASDLAAYKTLLQCLTAPLARLLQNALDYLVHAASLKDAPPPL
jgi:hypothetical protein